MVEQGKLVTFELRGRAF